MDIDDIKSPKERLLCSYKNCPTNREDFPAKIPIKYFQVPRNETRCKRWFTLAGRYDLLKKCTEAHKFHQICFLHFTDSMFLPTKQKCKNSERKLRLRSSAEPVLNGCVKMKNLEFQNAFKNKEINSKKLNCSCVMCYDVGSAENGDDSKLDAQINMETDNTRLNFKGLSDEEATILMEEILTCPEPELKTIVSNMCLEIEMNVRELYEEEDEIRDSLQDNLDELKLEYEKLFAERNKRGIHDSCKEEIIRIIMSYIPFEVKVESNALEHPSIDIKFEGEDLFEAEENNQLLSIELKTEDDIQAESHTDPLIKDLVDTNIHIKLETEFTSGGEENKQCLSMEVKTERNITETHTDPLIKDLGNIVINIKSEIEDIFEEENNHCVSTEVKIEDNVSRESHTDFLVEDLFKESHSQYLSMEVNIEDNILTETRPEPLIRHQQQVNTSRTPVDPSISIKTDMDHFCEEAAQTGPVLKKVKIV